MDIYHFATGNTPLLVSVPHAGTYVPPDIARRLSTPARALPDTDWHVDALYNFARGLDATMLVATHSRYVVDLNRDPGGAVLYSDQDNTELIPTTTFAREPIYQPGLAPADFGDLHARVEGYFRPYHDRLQTALAELHRQHGIAVLFDAHSIASRVPRFFSGELPHFNLGSRGGGSAAPDLVAAAMGVLENHAPFTAVCDQRFQGGYITRHYGRPTAGVHALQLELAQRAYMDESAAPDPAVRVSADQLPHAAAIRPVLHTLLATIIEWAQKHATRQNPG